MYLFSELTALRGSLSVHTSPCFLCSMAKDVILLEFTVTWWIVMCFLLHKGTLTKFVARKGSSVLRLLPKLKDPKTLTKNPLKKWTSSIFRNFASWRDNQFLASGTSFSLVSILSYLVDGTGKSIFRTLSRVYLESIFKAEMSLLVVSKVGSW